MNCLLNAITQQQQLKILTLDFNMNRSLTDDHCQLIKRIVDSVDDQCLEKLQIFIGHSLVTDEGFKCLLEAIKKKTKLKSLSLSIFKTQCTSESVKILSEAITEHVKLEEFEFLHDRFGNIK